MLQSVLLLFCPEFKQVDEQKKWKESAFSTKKKKRNGRERIFLGDFKLVLVRSFETDWANVQTEFLISSTNVQRCNVKDGQARWFVCSIFNDCFAPCVVLSL